MEFDDGLVFRIPAPSDGIETVLVLFGIAAILVGVLAALQHRETVARIWVWLKAHPWERASAPVNLLLWPVLIFLGPVAALLFGMALGEAYALLQQQSVSGSSIGSLGRGAVIVALIGAPFVIWRSVVAQKTVNVTEQGHITDRINTAVQGLGAEKTIKRQRKRQTGKLAYATGEDNEPDYSQPIMEEVTAPNLEVRIGAIYALERIAQDSDRDHVQIMEILCAYIRQHAPAPAEDDWPELEMKDSEDDGALEEDWEERLKTFRQAQEEAKAKLKLREDIQTALTVIGRRSARQRRLEAGRGVEAPFPFDTSCPEYNGKDDDDNRTKLDAYLEKLKVWKATFEAYDGYRLDLRNAYLRAADLAGAQLNGARLDKTFLQGADLRRVRLKGAHLERVRLHGANFEDGHFEGANLAEAQAHGAFLSGANLQGTRLVEAKMQGAKFDRTLGRGMGNRIRFIRPARLQGSYLNRACLQGAQMACVSLQSAFLIRTRTQDANFKAANLRNAMLHGARLQRTNLSGAELQGADLGEAQLDKDTDLSAANLQNASINSVDCTDLPQIAAHLEFIYGDASVTLPGGYGPEHDDWPPHWPTFDLGDDFDDKWQTWQADPDGYRPPDPPGPESAA